MDFNVMSMEEFSPYIQASTESYAAELERSGAAVGAEALRVAEKQLGELLPEGMATPGHTFATLYDAVSKARVGFIWYGPRTWDEEASCFLYDIVIDVAHRRRGYGRAAMGRLELEARRDGLQSIVLNVFAANVIAVQLYRSLGFEVIRIFSDEQTGEEQAYLMRKAI